MPNFIMPQSEEDNAYLQQLNRGTDYSTGATERQGDRQADSIRRQGAIIGDTLANAPSQYMEGARFKTQQEGEAQRQRIVDAEENRAQQRFTPELRSLNNSADILGVQKSGMEKAQAFEYDPLSEEDQQRYGAATRHGADWGTRREAELASIGGTNAATAGTWQSVADAKAAAQHARAREIAMGLGSPSAPGSAPAVSAEPAPMAQNLPPPAGADAGPPKSMAALYNQYSAPAAATPVSAPATAAAPQANAPSADARAAAIAARSGLPIEQARGLVAQMDMERSAAMRAQELGLESSRDTLPTSSAVRNQVSGLKDQLQQLNSALNQSDQYESAANLGGGSFLANLLQGGTDRGLVESEGQKQIRGNIASTLQQIDPAAAAEVRSSGMGDMHERLKQASNFAIQKKIDEIRTFINTHSRFRNDPEMQELQQNADKLAATLGNQKRNIVPQMRGSQGMSKVSFRNE